MPAKLFDRTSKKWVDARDEDVDSLVGSGTHAFESGIRIPVVSPDGTIGDIPSEQAEAAFREGAFRWSTPEDVRAFEDTENEAILNEAAGGAGDSFASGVSRGGTFGLSDVIVPAATELFGAEGDAEFAREALRRQKENSPKASIAGEVVGSLFGAPGLAIKGAKSGAGLLQEAGAISGLTRAATPLGRVGQEALVQGAEGMVFGLGEGISEAALGDPDEVVQNLASSVALGGLFGGAFGSLFGAGKELAPTAKAFVSKTAQAADETFQNVSRKAVSKVGERLLSKEDAKIFGDLVYDKEFVNLFEAYGDEGYDALKADFQLAQKSLEAEAAQTKKGLEAFLKNQPREMRKRIMEDVLPRNDGNFQAAMNDLDNEILGKATSLSSQLVESGAVSEGMEKFLQRSESILENMKLTNNSKAVKLANDFLNTIQAERSKRMVAEGVEDIFTAADERKILLDFRNRLDEAITGKSPENIKSMFVKYRNNIESTLHNSPLYGKAQKELDASRSAYNEMRKFLTASKTVKQASEKDIKASVLRSIMVDQNKARKFNDVMLNISQFAPEMEAFRKAGNDAIKQQYALDSILTKLNATRNTRDAMGERLTSEELGTFLKALDAPADILNRLERLKSLESTLQAQGATPATNMLATLKAFGHPITDIQEKIIAKGDQFEKLEKAFGRRHDPGMVEKLLKLAIKRPIRGLAGAAIGGMFGDTTGAILGAATTGAINPRFVLKNLAKLDRASTQATQRSAKATKAAIDALTSKKARKFVSAASGTMGAQVSLKEKRSNFKERAAYTTAMANDPNRIAEEFENRFGDMEYTPAIATAMMAQFTKTAQFLDSKLPKDPLAGQYLSAFHSKWQPTDFQLAQYERYVRAVEDPISVVEDLARGKTSPEAIEALKEINPILFKELQDGVLNAIMNPDVNPSYQQKLLIGTLFDIPTDPTLSPSFISTMQSTYQEQADSGMAPTAMAPKKSVHIDINPEAIATETTRISNS